LTTRMRKLDEARCIQMTLALQPAESLGIYA
jgi:hypothetical protein